jgi:hypothetical protein
MDKSLYVSFSFNLVETKTFVIFCKLKLLLKNLALPPMKNFRIELKWGVIFFLSGLLWMVLEKSLGWHDSLIAQHATYSLAYAPIAIFIYVLALKDKKKNTYAGKMSFVQGLVSGLIITVVVVLLTPLSQYITHELVSPSYFPNIIAYSVQQGRLTLSEAEAYFTLKNYITQSILFAAFMGGLTTAGVMFFLRTKAVPQ